MPQDDLPTGDLGASPSASRGVTDIRPGDRIGRYIIRQPLGEGGMGTVYQAEQVEPVRREVALKVIKLGMDSRAVVARFEAERQALALMDHPSVAKVFDGGVTETGRPYFAMELVRGLSITDHCDRHKLGIRERVALFIRVCEAVQHAHSKGVIHRDLKPSNVLVSYQGDEHIPKIIDFGVAKALNQRLTEASVFTQVGQLIGTPEYMSPEQAEMTTQDIDTRSDVYSLGVILYELLTGSRPFEPEMLRTAGLAEIQRIIREVDPPRPSTRLGSSVAHPDPGTATKIAETRRTEIRSLTGVLRRDLDWVVMKCLEKDRSHRYDTAHALAEELQRYLGNEPVLAGPPTASYRVRKFVRRHRGAVFATALIAGCLVSATAVSTVFYLREAQARRDEAAARERAEIERGVAESINSFLNTDLLGSVDPDTDGPDVRVVDILDRAARAAEDRFEQRPEVRARVLGTLGASYMLLGSPGKAEPLLRGALRDLRELPESDTDATLIMETRLMESLWRRGQPDEAIEIGLRLHAETEGLDPISDNRLRVQNQLASAYKYAGRIEEAQPLYEAVYQARLASLGASDLQTLRARYNLALLPVLRGVEARRNGDQAEADRWFESGLAELRASYAAALEALGPDHSHTLTCASEVTSQLNRLGRVDEADPIYRELLAAMERRLGASHWRRLQTLANFGRMMQREKRYAEAKPALLEALEGYRQWRGVTSAETLTITGWAAETLAALGETDSAVEILGTAISEQPPDSEAIHGMVERGASILRRAGRDDEAMNWPD